MPRRMYIESGDQITVVLPLGGQVFKVQGRVGLRVVAHEKVMELVIEPSSAHVITVDDQ